jgi:hypothetical protein
VTLIIDAISKGSNLHGRHQYIFSIYQAITAKWQADVVHDRSFLTAVGHVSVGIDTCVNPGNAAERWCWGAAGTDGCDTGGGMVTVVQGAMVVVPSTDVVVAAVAEEGNQLGGVWKLGGTGSRFFLLPGGQAVAVEVLHHVRTILCIGGW